MIVDGPPTTAEVEIYFAAGRRALISIGVVALDMLFVWEQSCDEPAAQEAYRELRP